MKYSACSYIILIYLYHTNISTRLKYSEKKNVFLQRNGNQQTIFSSGKNHNYKSLYLPIHFKIIRVYFSLVLAFLFAPRHLGIQNKLISWEKELNSSDCFKWHHGTFFLQCSSTCTVVHRRSSLVSAQHLGFSLIQHLNINLLL